MNSVDTCVLVVPCFNEAARLDPAPFLGMLQARAGLSLLFVDDGSTDGTRAALDALSAQDPFRISVLDLPSNGGVARSAS